MDLNQFELTIKTKAGLSTSKFFFVICFIESHLKMIKNAYFSSKNLFSFSRYLKFYNDFMVM